jgi:hypothetical protein
MPVDHSTIAGTMYYVCDSAILKDFDRMSILGENEKNTLIMRAGTKYRVGKIIGLSERSRRGIRYNAEKQS